MPRLIVNADDFGLTPGVNRAILEAHRGGMVTSATLMSNAPAFDDAVRRARSCPSLQVGCHVVLIGGEALLPRESVRSLAPSSAGSIARFRDSLPAFAAAALSGRLRPQEVEAEVTAQIRKCQSAGLEITHLDSHKHTHIFPAVLEPLLRAARACGVRAIRNPIAARRAGGSLLPPGLWTRYLGVRAMRHLAASFLRLVEAAGLRTTDGCLGILEMGRLDEPLFAALLARVPEGTWEFVCHPGYNDAELQRAGTRLQESREKELRALTSESARQALGARGIELISFQDL